jgi:hypothetical protein
MRGQQVRGTWPGSGWLASPAEPGKEAGAGRFCGQPRPLGDAGIVLTRRFPHSSIELKLPFASAGRVLRTVRPSPRHQGHLNRLPTRWKRRHSHANLPAGLLRPEELGHCVASSSFQVSGELREPRRMRVRPVFSAAVVLLSDGAPSTTAWPDEVATNTTAALKAGRDGL